jgi:hypothetical protein
MDKFNVITPTADLDELTADMSSWCLLPYDMRMRSDEECIRTFGCTNWDLYNNIKEKILANDDLNKIDKNNLTIQTESDDVIGHWSNYTKLIRLSDELQESPYIVIITPDDDKDDADGCEQLMSKYINYMLLNDKNRRISNDYSVKIWGLNVPAMYSRIINCMGARKSWNKFYNDECPGTPKHFADDNIHKVEESMIPLVNERFDSMVVSENFLDIERIKLDSLSPYIIESSKEVYNTLISEANNFDNIDSYLLQETPWFNHSELSHFDLPKYGYMYSVKEAMNKFKEDPSFINEEAVLNLGWNPSVDINESSIKYAKQRQLNYLNENAPRVINLSNLNTDNIEMGTPELYFNLYIVLNKSVLSDVNLYNKFGISFGHQLQDIYTVNIKDDICLGFAKESLVNYLDIDVICFRVDRSTYEALARFISLNKTIEKSDLKIRSLYSLLAQTKNKFDPATARLYYLKILDIIKELISYNNEMDKFEISYNDKVFLYKIYSGLAKDYNDDNVLKIINILNCKTNRERFIINNSKNYTISQENSNEAIEIYKEMVTMLTPVEVIMSISD